MGKGHFIIESPSEEWEELLRNAIIYTDEI